MKIGIVGAGAMGSVYGGLFAAAGHDVWLVDLWREHIDAIRKDGLHVSGASGERTVRPSATTNPAEAGPCELVVLSTKMRDLEAAARSIGPMVGGDTVILAIQNGLGNQEILERVLGARDFLVGIAGGFGASNPKPGAVHHNGWDHVHIAESAGGHSARLQRVVDVWRDAGFNAQVLRRSRSDDLGQVHLQSGVQPGMHGAVAAHRTGAGQSRGASAGGELCTARPIDVASAKGIKLDFTDAGRAHPRIRPRHSQCASRRCCSTCWRDDPPKSMR